MHRINKYISSKLLIFDFRSWLYWQYATNMQISDGERITQKLGKRKKIKFYL